MSDLPELDPVLDLGFDPSEQLRKPYLAALEAHLDFISYLRTTVGHKAAASIAYTLAEQQSGNRELGDEQRKKARESMRLIRQMDIGIMAAAARGIRELIETCETIYVAPNFVELANIAAETYPETHFREYDLVTKSGFMYFARPIALPFYSLDGDEVVATPPLRGNGPGTLHQQDDDPDPELLDRDVFVVRGVFWTPLMASPQPGSYRVHWLIKQGDEQDSPEALEEGFGDDWRDYRWVPVYTHQIAESVVLGEYTYPLKWFMALNMLINQKVGYMRGVKPPRQLRRQADRAMPGWGDIRVVHLRRRVPRNPNETGDAEEVHWSHRWVVRGHWRNQWFPSENRHKPVWIAPFVKGPEDRPLIVKDHILSADR